MNAVAWGLRLLPWVAALISCWPMIAEGFPQGHDWIFELTRAAQYQTALLAGQLPPYWAESLFAGYGAPVYLFYPPLFSAGTSLLAWVSGSIPSGALLLLLLLSALSVPIAHGMFRLAAAPPSDPNGPASAASLEAAARIGVYLYVLNPYLIGDKLLRNADAEFAALCLAPLVIHGVLLAEARPRRSFALLSGGLALLILAHNMTALLALGLSGLAAAILYLAPLRPRVLARLGGAVAIGLAIAAFFWIPAMTLQPLIRAHELIQGKFDFHNQFPTLAQAFGYELFFAGGLLTPAVLGLALFDALRTKRDWSRARRLGLAAPLGALGFVFLLTPASTFVWESVPLLPFFQFPWRMMGPLALLAALSGALVFARLLVAQPELRRAGLELGVFVACVLNAGPQLAQYRPLPAEFSAQAALFLSPETLRNTGAARTVTNWAMPIAADAAAWQRDRPTQGPVVSSLPPTEIRLLRSSGLHLELEVQAAAPARLRLARWHFPGWVLMLDGKPAEPIRSPTGAIDVQVPAGRTHVELHCEPPTLRKWTLAASVLALGIWLYLVIVWPDWLFRRVERRST